MLYGGDEKAPVALKVHRGHSGGVELVRTSNGGTTVYFDSPEDAIRRLNTWMSEPGAELAAIDLKPTLNSVFGRVESPADTLEVDQPKGDNRRSEARLSPGDVNWFRGARSAYGADVRVVDISSNGVLIETDHELAPETAIAIELLGKNGALRVAGRVLRCRRFAHGDFVWYEIGCRFKRPLDLKALAPTFLASGDTTILVAGSRVARPGSTETSRARQRLIVRRRSHAADQA